LNSSVKKHLLEDAGPPIKVDTHGVVAVLKIYMDESGIHDDSPVVTVSAYMAKPTVWQKWTKKWNAAKRPIKVFHAADCANYRGEFKDWNQPRRDKYVAKLLPVITSFPIGGLVIGMNLEDFRAALKGREDLIEAFGGIYATCFQWVIGHILNVAAELESKQRIAFIHEVNDYKKEATEAFAYLKQNIRTVLYR